MRDALLLLKILYELGVGLSADIRMAVVMEKAVIPLQNSAFIHREEIQTLRQQIGKIQRMKDRPKRIDQDVKLSVPHLLPNRLGKAGTHTQDFALVGNREPGFGNREIDRPAHGVKLLRKKKGIPLGRLGAGMSLELTACPEGFREPSAWIRLGGLPPDEYRNELHPLISGLNLGFRW